MLKKKQGWWLSVATIILGSLNLWNHFDGTPSPTSLILGATSFVAVGVLIWVLLTD